MGWFSAALAAANGALKAWNHERGKADAVEKVQLGMEIARSKDSKAVAKAAVRVAEIMTEQMDEDDLDTLARSLAAGRKRVRESVPG